MKWFVSLLVLIFALQSNAESQSFDFEDEPSFGLSITIRGAEGDTLTFTTEYAGFPSPSSTVRDKR